MTQTYAYHPAANIFPLLSGQEFEDLVADIRSEGLHSPIVLHEGQVLDGRNRLLACQRAGVTPRFTDWDGKGSSATSWVISLNLQRRHLEAGQRAAVAVEAKPLLEVEAKKNQKLGGDASTFVNIDKPRIETPIHARKEVAEQFNVSSGYVHAVQKIKDASPDTFEQVKAGTISIPEAQRQLGMKQTVKSLLSSDSNEWYTPTEYVEAARQVMGAIDLDPASNELANEVVKATAYYTQHDDGLARDWHGRVWLNPPYADLGPKFVGKLLEEFSAGNVSEAILLVNPRTDTVWFQPLFDFTLCFASGRIKFWRADGSGESPTTGSVLIYFRPNREKFTRVFSQFGAVLVKSSTQNRKAL